MQADLTDRMQAGLSEDEAVSATLAEMGDPAQAAKGLNRVHSGASSELRTLTGLQIMLLGFFGSITATERLGDIVQGLEGRLDGGFWHDRLVLSLQWIVEHELHQFVLFPLILAGLAFVVGYLTRKNAWNYTFLPVVIF